MPESGPYGSVRGALSNGCLYRDSPKCVRWVRAWRPQPGKERRIAGFTAQIAAETRIWNPVPKSAACSALP